MSYNIVAIQLYNDFLNDVSANVVVHFFPLLYDVFDASDVNTLLKYFAKI